MRVIGSGYQIAPLGSTEEGKALKGPKFRKEQKGTGERAKPTDASS